MMELAGEIFITSGVVLAILLYTGAFRHSIVYRGVIHEIAHGISSARLKPNLSGMSDGSFSIAWIGHATCYINMFGVKILTDPVFGDRVGVETPWLGVVGARRLVEPAIPIAEIPKPDIIAITHAHMDHLDIPSLRLLPKDSTLLIPTGLSDIVEGLGFAKVVEIGWNSPMELCGLDVEAFMPKHWGKRTPWEKKSRNFNSYLFSRNGKTLLVAGDTAYTEAFAAAGKRRHIDYAVFDLGAYQPRWFRRNHSTSEDIWRMFQESGAEYLLPVHWGTFILSQEGINDPMLWLRAVAGDEFYGKVKLQHIGEVWSDPSRKSSTTA